MTGINQIFEEAKNCDLCFGKNPIYVPKPDPKNGFQDVKIMFINERPGRIGTGKSGYISFDNDDPTANFFRECFYSLHYPVRIFLSQMLAFVILNMRDITIRPRLQKRLFHVRSGSNSK